MPSGSLGRLRSVRAGVAGILARPRVLVIRILGPH